MTNHPNRSKKCRAREHLRATSIDYPDVWNQYDTFRQGRGKDGLPGWPEWCYCPATACTVASESAPDIIARLGALAAWRLSQGVYQFNPALYASIIASPVENLPTEAWYRLPEWCVYIDTPGLSWDGNFLAGFFAHLEYNTNTERAELRLLLDVDSEQGPVLVSQSIFIDETILEVSTPLKPLLGLVLYLCNADLGENAPRRPLPKKTKSGWKMFPPDKPKVWNIGGLR